MDNNHGEMPQNIILSEDINKNIGLIRSIFKQDETLIVRQMKNRHTPLMDFCIIYIDGMVDNKLMNEDVIRPMLEYKFTWHTTDVMDVIAKQVTLSDSVEKTTDIEKIIQAIVYGDCVLLGDNCSEVLILNTKGWISRSITEPEGEKVLKGPREGFNEAIMMNLSMLRRKMRTADLKMKFKVFGTRTKTKACICYLDSVVNKKVLAEFEKRLEKISIDGTLDVNYIAEFIKDTPYSPVKTVGTTERPDVVAAKLLEGRVALFLDGTPVVLTLPHLFIEFFQSDEDYYVNYYFASIGRLLRLLSFFIATSLPSLYIALTTFHQEMLPTPLLISISMARQGVPFPTVVEMLLMMIVFEILRESGARMPGMMGQALSIVGALVMGQAAVEAKFVSAPIIIIVAIVGICGLMSPRIKSATIIIRFSLLLFSSLFGLYGYLFGLLAVIIHVLNLSSFGIPIVNSSYATDLQDKKDIYIRAPWWLMKKRPNLLSKNRIRQSSDGGEK